jgi:hypothetical protein
MPTKTLVAFSGGWDSTLILWKLLNETNDEITAVYLDSQFVKTDIGTIKEYVQFIRAQKVVDELRKIRNFEFISYKIKPSDITEELYLKYLQFVQYAAPFINDGTYDKLVHGASYEDASCKILPHLEYFPTYYVVQRLFDRLCTRGELYEPLIKDNTWYEHYTRAHAMLELPINIKAVVASCDDPEYDNDTNDFVDCGECRKCLENKLSSDMLTAGKTPEEILQWKKQKSIEYGTNELMAPLIFWIRKEMGRTDRVLPAEAATDILNHPMFRDIDKLTGVWEGIYEPL